jgi:integrase
MVLHVFRPQSRAVRGCCCSFAPRTPRAVEREGLRKIRLHDLRHTHATIAVKAGVPVKVVSERLGHESPAFTLKQYAHVVPGMQAEAAVLIAAVVQGDRAGEPERATSASTT